MDDIFGIPVPLLFGQLLLGLINGAFYAMLSLGLAIIFGLLNIINFTHGAQFMMGAFVAWMLLSLGSAEAARIGLTLMLLPLDRKSTRLNSSHANISYAVFCLKTKRTVAVWATLFDR